MSQFRVKAELECGAIVEVIQRQPNMILEVQITPKPGGLISDTAWIKDGKLQVNLTVESAIGLYQFLDFILTKRKRRKFFGIF